MTMNGVPRPLSPLVARQIALLALKRAEERWEKFARREAEVFMSIHNDKDDTGRES